MNARQLTPSALILPIVNAVFKDMTSSPESKRIGLNSRIRKFDRKYVFAHVARLADQLVKALFVHGALAVFIDVGAMIGRGRLPVQGHAEPQRCPAPSPGVNRAREI